MLLAQIKANYSSGDDVSSEEETQGDDSEDEKVKQGNEDMEIDENGKYYFCFLKKQISSFPLVYLKNK